MIHHLSTSLLNCQYGEIAYKTNSDNEQQLATEWAQLEKPGSTIQKSKHVVDVV